MKYIIHFLVNQQGGVLKLDEGISDSLMIHLSSNYVYPIKEIIFHAGSPGFHTELDKARAGAGGVRPDINQDNRCQAQSSLWFIYFKFFEKKSNLDISKAYNKSFASSLRSKMNLSSLQKKLVRIILFNTLKSCLTTRFTAHFQAS